MPKNLSELSGRKGIVDSLFEKMGQAAVEEGTPSKEELGKLADEFLIGKANTYGAATFYDFMKPENKGKKVYVCNGSACLCAETQDGVKKELKKHFKEEEIGHMTCLGRCHENAAFHLGGYNYSGKAIKEIRSVIAENHKSSRDSYAVEAHGIAVLTAEYDKKELFHLLRNALRRDSIEILDEIKGSGLRGRGGAGFPIGFKLESCRSVESDTKFIICNADEGDPGAYSDRYLLEERPLAVLFGMMVAGYAAGANWGVLYIRAEYPDSVEIIESAIEELRHQNLLGEDIQGSGFTFDFKIIKAQGAYICGEETALINSIEGQRPEVRARPPYPTQEGLFGKPTAVNNVETLAGLLYIIQHGGRAYKAIGTERSSGTKLVCLDGRFNRPGIVEVEMGTPLSEVVYKWGDGFKEPVKALHIGGPLGGIVPLSKIDDLTVDFESFTQAGFLLGHASVVSIPKTFSLMEYINHLFDFASYESCGKCFPCRLGTKRGHELTEGSLKNGMKIDRELFDDLLHTLASGSLCAHGGGIPLPVRNAMEYFNDELKAYFN